MPRRKKLPQDPDYENIGRNPENHIIQKSNPLLTLSETDLTLTEFKILDAYLARIDSHKPEGRFVKFDKGKIEEYLGVTQIKSPDLEKRIDNLFQVVTIRDQVKTEGFTKIALFEKARCYQDKDGLWQVELACSQSAMEYVFNVENIGYLRYRLKNVINLTSRYSYVLYLYLEQNRKMHLTWEVDLDELKGILRCTAGTYKSYYRFNDLILKKCCLEINEKTQCKFSYEPIRKGRAVKKVCFSLKSLSPELGEGKEDTNQITITDWQNDEARQDIISFLQEACSPGGTDKCEFTKAEMKEILTVLVDVPDSMLPTNVPIDSIEFRRYHYLTEKYARMNRMSEKNPVKNRVAYLVAMIKADCGR